MALLCVVAAYNEERLLADCVRSALAAGVDECHVFDGAWRAGDSGPAFAGASSAPSTDDTAGVAERAGAIVHPPLGLWENQGAKRTAMFHGAGAGPGDHLFVLDADERVTGRFPDELPDEPVNVLLRSVGPNDLPGIRADWPDGDYSLEPRPCLRVFAWRPDLACIDPGHYIADGERIDPYHGRRSILWLARSVCVEHHANLRDRERLAQKRDYYRVDHPARPARLAARLGELPPRPSRRRRTSMTDELRIANRRIVDIHPVSGRRVLVAAEGQPIPDWYEDDQASERVAQAPASVPGRPETQGGKRRAARRTSAAKGASRTSGSPRKQAAKKTARKSSKR